MNDPGDPPRTGYWHPWTDADGLSHHARGELTDFQWNDKQARGEATVVFTVQPAGWVGDWHENPAPQWIVPLTGRWWVEAMDGTHIEMGPGQLSLGEDQGRTAGADGTVGDEPAHPLTNPMHVEPVGAPCSRQ